MKKNRLNFLLSFAFLFLAGTIWAQIPKGYYVNVDGKNKGALKTAFSQSISSHTTISYAGLWEAFKTTDKRSNGKVWDMYSDVPGGTPAYSYTFGTNQCGNYSGEGSCYNREHSFPKSWFNDQSPMYSDLFHLYPTDGYVNGRRGNLPFGEVGITSWKSTNGSLVGKGAMSGYSGDVFEPIDEYKGDFARTYFYMVTCYEDKIGGWSSPHLNGTKYPGFNTWSIDLLLKWHREDPVSQKEIDRNNAVYAKQKNRNPYIDFAGLAEFVWGNKMDMSFDSGVITGIADPNKSDIISPVYQNGQIIVLSNNKEGILEVFNTLGTLVIKQKLMMGDNYIDVPSNQFLIIRCNGVSSKIYSY